MAKVTRATLKTYFETGDKPTQAQFASLIDSNLNINDGGDVSGSVTINYASQSFSLSASLSAVKLDNLPTTIAQARLIGSGSLIASGSTVNAGLKPLYVFTG